VPICCHILPRIVFTEQIIEIDSLRFRIDSFEQESLLRSHHLLVNSPLLPELLKLQNYGQLLLVDLVIWRQLGNHCWQLLRLCFYFEKVFSTDTQIWRLNIVKRRLERHRGR